MRVHIEFQSETTKMQQFFQHQSASEQSNKEPNSFKDNELLRTEKPDSPTDKCDDKILIVHKIAFIDEPNIKIFCQDCRKELNNVVTVLRGPDYRCVCCFAKLQPSKQSFQVLKSLNFPIIDANWKAKHEILFLNLLQKFGFGNWKQIKEQMSFYGAEYSQQQLYSHYNSCYIQSVDCLPKIVKNGCFFESQDFQRDQAMVSTQLLMPSLKAVQNRQENRFLEIDEFYAKHFKSINEPNFTECYNEKRKQFEIQYDPNAEMLLANLQFREDDSEEETRIKFKLIEQYNRRLDRRNKVKQFIVEHRLLEEGYQKEMDRNRNEYERQAFEQLRPLARMMSLQEYNELVQKVALTKQLKSTIEGLRMFRRAHPSNFKSLDQFLSSQPEQSRPRRRRPNACSIKTGKKVEQVLERQFNLSKQDFQAVVQNLQSGKKKSSSFKNVEVVVLQKVF